MATLYSNELKAVVVMDNFLDNPMNVLKENCMTVQHFNYNCDLSSPSVQTLLVRPRHSIRNWYPTSIPTSLFFLM